MNELRNTVMDVLLEDEEPTTAQEISQETKLPLPMVNRILDWLHRHRAVTVDPPPIEFKEELKRLERELADE